MVFGFGVNSLILLIMNSLMTQLGGLKEEELVSKLVYFGANGVSTFQGFKYRITIQIQC
jgi:hypothetical protein